MCNEKQWTTWIHHILGLFVDKWLAARKKRKHNNAVKKVKSGLDGNIWVGRRYRAPYHAKNYADDLLLQNDRLDNLNLKANPFGWLQQRNKQMQQLSATIIMSEPNHVPRCPCYAHHDWRHWNLWWYSIPCNFYLWNWINILRDFDAWNIDKEEIWNSNICIHKSDTYRVVFLTAPPPIKS